MIRAHRWAPAENAAGEVARTDRCQWCGLYRRPCDDLGAPAFQLSWDQGAHWFVVGPEDRENGGCASAP